MCKNKVLNKLKRNYFYPQLFPHAGVKMSLVQTCLCTRCFACFFFCHMLRFPYSHTLAEEGKSAALKKKKALFIFSG